MAFFAHPPQAPLKRDKLALDMNRNIRVRESITDRNHTFANNVRFLSMAAIIGIHTLTSYPSALGLPSMPAHLLYFMQPLKFGTIGFFLISGFLFGERVDQYSPFEYFSRRLRNIFLPWFVWFMMFFALRMGVNFLRGRHSSSYYTQAFTTGKTCLLDTAFWFVPNLLIALAVLLIFRRFLNHVWVGLVFLLTSLFYGINIYGHWFAVRHTHAAFGFVFFLWLGAWSSWHFPVLERRLARVPAGLIISLVLLTHMLALAESRFLFAQGSIDPMNTLRISNQLYSVATVLAIVKLRRAVWPHFVDVRANTFGLYLTHTVVLALIAAMSRQLLPHLAAPSWWIGNYGALLLLPLIFVVAYGGCLLIVRALLAYPRLRWTVGLPVKNRQSAGKLVTA